MKTIEQLRAENAEKEKTLAAELELAEQCLFPPDGVQLNSSLGPWITYRKRTLAEALEMFKASPVVPCFRYKGTFTRVTPAALAKPDCGEQVAGPFAVELNVSEGEGFGPSLTLSFFTTTRDGRICRARIDIEGPGYIGTFHAVSHTPKEERDGRGRITSRTYRPNALLNGLCDNVITWSSGDMGPIKRSAQTSYLLMCDQDETAQGTENVHACAQLQNLIDSTEPARQL